MRAVFAKLSCRMASGAGPILTILLALGAPAQAQQSSFASTDETQPGITFEAWLGEFRREAIGRGISQATLDRAFKGVAPIERVVELDRRQPEFTLTLGRYLANAVTEQRIARGRTLLGRHAGLLEQVRRQYGVQPRFLIAFWGLETNFGDYTGGFSVIAALTTLAYDPRRSGFFRNELIQALKIIDAGHITPEAMTGSWAGAMGQLQFMPSTFVAYAVDGNGDGRQDIWHDLDDVFASAANYLNTLGWHGDQTWGREVRLPPGFDWSLADLEIEKSIADWQALGVRRADGSNLPRVDIEGSILLPAGHKGPAFLVYRNFRTTMIWNRSTLYAVAVGYLADRIAGKGPLAVKPAADEPRLKRSDVAELQKRLTGLGFDAGAADGLLGPKTRAALKGFQRSRNLPADGYPTREALALLRGS